MGEMKTIFFTSTCATRQKITRRSSGGGFTTTRKIRQPDLPNLGEVRSSRLPNLVKVVREDGACDVPPRFEPNRSTGDGAFEERHKCDRTLAGTTFKPSSGLRGLTSLRAGRPSCRPRWNLALPYRSALCRSGDEGAGKQRETRLAVAPARRILSDTWMMGGLLLRF